MDDKSKITDPIEVEQILQSELEFWMDVEREAKRIKLELFKTAQAENPIKGRPRRKRGRNRR